MQKPRKIPQRMCVGCREKRDKKDLLRVVRTPEGQLVLDATGSVTDYALYALGMRDNAELDKMIQQFAQNQDVDVPEDFKTYRYSDFLGRTFKLVNAADRYQYDDAHSTWVDKSDDKAFLQELVANSETMTIVGVVQPRENASAAMLSSGIAYPASLTRHVMDLSLIHISEPTRPY